MQTVKPPNSSSYKVAILKLIWMWAVAMHISLYTVNREYFVVKIFSDSQACAKIERTKIHAQY